MTELHKQERVIFSSIQAKHLSKYTESNIIKCICHCYMIVTFHFNESPTIPRNGTSYLCPANIAASLNFIKKLHRPQNER